MSIEDTQALLIQERTKRKRMQALLLRETPPDESRTRSHSLRCAVQSILSTANTEVAEHQMRIFELQSKEQDRDRLQVSPKFPIFGLDTALPLVDPTHLPPTPLCICMPARRVLLWLFLSVLPSSFSRWTAACVFSLLIFFFCSNYYEWRIWIWNKAS